MPQNLRSVARGHAGSGHQRWGTGHKGDADTEAECLTTKITKNEYKNQHVRVYANFWLLIGCTVELCGHFPQFFINE